MPNQPRNLAVSLSTVYYPVSIFCPCTDFLVASGGFLQWKVALQTQVLLHPRAWRRTLGSLVLLSLSHLSYSEASYIFLWYKLLSGITGNLTSNWASVPNWSLKKTHLVSFSHSTNAHWLTTYSVHLISFYRSAVSLFPPQNNHEYQA